LRRPTSIRGEREKRRAKAARIAQDAPRAIAAPEWLAESARPVWAAVLHDLQEAGVPLEQIDAHAVGMYTLCIEGARSATTAGDARLAARYTRDGIAWSREIGGTPASRARLNLKPAAKIVADPWEGFE
jgi:phage terminase small subunit